MIWNTWTFIQNFEIKIHFPNIIDYFEIYKILEK